MTNANLCKLLFILDSQVQQVIEFEGDCYLICCSGKEHSTRNQIAFYFSTQLRTGAVTALCRECYCMHHNETQKTNPVSTKYS